MELDDFKTAWQVLDRRLELQNALQMDECRERKLGRVRSRLRPLFWGQAIQLLIGVVVVLVSGSFWFDHRRTPHLLAAGLIVHAYGIATIISSGRTLGLIAAIDYALPVLAIQQQLALLRQWYIRCGLGLGLSWWLLWMPLMMMLFMGAFGADLFANAPSVIWVGSAIGAAGLLITWLFYRWAHQPGRSRLAGFIADSSAGRSIVRAQAVVDEVARFVRE